MIIDIKNNDIELIDSCNITMLPWGGVFFEGYFFVGDKFYRGKDAIEYIVCNKESVTERLF